MQKLPNPARPRQIFLAPFFQKWGLSLAVGRINRSSGWVFVPDDGLTRFVQIAIWIKLFKDIILFIRWNFPEWLIKKMTLRRIDHVN